MPLLQRLAVLVTRFVGSYVGLVVLPLLVVVLSMNALSANQQTWHLFRRMLFPDASFRPLESGDYRAGGDVRSIVVRFENGVASQLREAITSLTQRIQPVSRAIIDEARRDDAARAGLAQSSQFGLSADTARAVAAPPLTAGDQRGTGLGARPLPTASASGPTVSPGPRIVGQVATPQSTGTPPPGDASGDSPGPNSTQALPLDQDVSFSTPAGPLQETPPPFSTPPGAPDGTATVVLTVAPTPTAIPITPIASVTAAPPLSTATAGVSLPSVTPGGPGPGLPGAATPEQLPTQSGAIVTRVPGTPTRTPEPGGGDPGPSTTATPTTPAEPEFVMDLSLPGGVPLSIQPIFSGVLQFRAGQAQTRTVNVQNNGTRAFRYSVGTAGGSGPLWTDTAGGLQMVIAKNGAEVYRGPLSMADQHIGQLARGGQDTLVITVFLPSSAGNAFQGLTTTVSFTFTATAVGP